MGLGGRILGTVVIVGAGALAVTAVLTAPRLLVMARPTAREALRRSLKLYERARHAAAELVEDMEDLAAEVQAGIGEKRAPEAQNGANES